MTEEYQKEIADEFRKTYPCFMYVPQGPDGWDVNKLISQIEQIKNDYRIDTTRIYLHGFSMGGYGSFRLANAYYQYNGQLFAGIIILSGGHQNLDDAIVEKTALWTHAGCEQASDLAGANNTYNYLKNHPYNTGSIESEKLNYVIGEEPYQHTANTITLTKKGEDFVKKTEYPGLAILQHVFLLMILKYLNGCSISLYRLNTTSGLIKGLQLFLLLRDVVFGISFKFQFFFSCFILISEPWQLTRMQ
jgi:predicted esterase